MQTRTWQGYATFVDHDGSEMRVFANLVSIKPRHLWESSGTLKPIDEWTAFLPAFNAGRLCKLRLNTGQELEVGIRSPGSDEISVFVNAELPE